MIELQITFMDTDEVSKYVVNKYEINNGAIVLSNLIIPEDQAHVPMGSVGIIPMHRIKSIIVKSHSRVMNVVG